MLAAIRKTMAPLARKITAIAARATITALDDSGPIQLVQVTALAGERLSGVQRLQMFGFTGVPPVGSSGLLICLNGSRTHPLFVGGEDGSRMHGVGSGESAVHNAAGDYVWIQHDGTIVVKSSKKVIVDAPEGEMTGNWVIDGTLEVKGPVKCDQTLDVTGVATLESNASVGGNLAIAGNSAVEGTSTGTGAATFSGGVGDGTHSLESLREFDITHTHYVGDPVRAQTYVAQQPEP